MLAPAAARRAGRVDGRLPRPARARSLRPARCPTDDEPSLAFVVPNLAAFEEAWSIDRRDLRFAVALHEVVHAAERSVPWVRERLLRLAIEYVSAYEVDPHAFEAQFGELDPNDPSSFAGIAEHPEALLGAMQSERQHEILDAGAGASRWCSRATPTSSSSGSAAGSSPTSPRIHEALQRHHVERGEAERFIEQLLGLRLDREHYERGEPFCRGVIERAGMDGLNRLWESERDAPDPERARRAGPLARPDRPPRSRTPGRPIACRHAASHG